MLRTLLKLTATAALLALAAGAQTVDEIIAKNIQAHGGMEKIKSIQTMRVTGKYNQGSFRAGFTQENKRPGKVREENIVQGLADVESYDGKIGWHVNPFSGRKDAVLLPADDLKGLLEDADMDGPLVDYKEKGHKAELVGHDPVEGTDCYKIKLTLKSGDARYYWLDTDSYLELKLETQRMIRGSLEESDTFFGDYEEVNGVFFPFEFEGAEKGDPNRTTYTVDKIEINVPLDDSRFAMPATPGHKPESPKPGMAQ